MPVTGGVDMARLGLYVEMHGAREGDAALKGLETQGARTEASFNRLRTSSQGAGAGISRLREPLTSLTYQLAGTNPQLSRMVSILGSMAVGSSVMVGVLLGVAAVSATYRKLTEDAREATEANDQLIQGFKRWLAVQREAAASPAAGQLAGLDALRGELRDIGAEMFARDLAGYQMRDYDPSRYNRLRDQYIAKLEEIRKAEIDLNTFLLNLEDARVKKAIEASDRATEAHKNGVDNRIKDTQREWDAQVRAAQQAMDALSKTAFALERAMVGIARPGGPTSGGLRPLPGLPGAGPYQGPAGMNEARLQRQFEADRAREAEDIVRARDRETGAIHRQIAGLESAARSTLGFLSALDIMDEKTVRLVDSIIGLGASIASGNVLGMITGGVAVLANALGPDREAEAKAAQELARLAVEAARAAEAVARYTASLADDLQARRAAGNARSSWDAAQGREDRAFLSQVPQASRNAISLIDVQAYLGIAPDEIEAALALWRDMFGEHIALWLELQWQQQREFEQIVEGERRSTEQAARNAEVRLRQAELDRVAFGHDIAIGILTAQGRDEEAMAMRRSLEEQMKVADATDRFGEAMGQLLLQLFAAEDAARAAAAAEAELARSRQATADATNLNQTVHGILNPDDPTNAWRRQWDSVIAEATRLANSGGISQQQFMDIAKAAQADFEKRRRAFLDAQNAARSPVGGGAGDDNLGGRAAQAEVIRGVRGITESQALRLADVTVVQLAVQREQLAVQRAILQIVGGSSAADMVNRALGRLGMRDRQLSGDMSVTK